MKAFEKKQNDLYDANVKKANEENDAIEARAQQVITGKKPLTPDQRAIKRCITSGRLPASCPGNALLGAFSQMVSQVLPEADKEARAGPVMAGVFQGAGNWRRDFIDGGVLVNCSILSPNQRNYELEFKNNRTALVIDTTPKPLVLTLRADGTIVGPGPLYAVALRPSDSVSATLRFGLCTHWRLTLRRRIPSQSLHRFERQPREWRGWRRRPRHIHAQNSYLPGAESFDKGSGTGVQTMQTDLLKTMFGGDKGAPTQPGIRMQGIFAAATGFSVQFFPESAVLGCGPDAARAYPYMVAADGTNAVIQIGAPNHPLRLTFRPDGSLDPGGTGGHQVHGRSLTGQNEVGDFTFAPMEQTCNLAVLAPSKTIPPSGGTAATMTASAGSRGTKLDNGGGTLSVPDAPLGNATLSIVSGFPAQPGTPNPLAGRPFVILRDSYADALAKGGVSVPPGMSPYKYVASVCVCRTPECQKTIDAIKVNAASAARGDANGSGTLPGVPAGTYYLMISTRYNNQALIWEQAVQLKAGQNSLKLDQSNATPLN